MRVCVTVCVCAFHYRSLEGLTTSRCELCDISSFDTAVWVGGIKFPVVMLPVSVNEINFPSRV